MRRSFIFACSSSSSTTNHNNNNAFKLAVENNQQQQQHHSSERKGRFAKSFSQHTHRPKNSNTIGGGADKDQQINQQLDNFINAFNNNHHRHSGGFSSSSSSSSKNDKQQQNFSLINRLKDNHLQQRWANSLSLFDNVSDEIKAAKWKPFHISEVLEVNRKHNRSPDSRREQFAKIWGFMRQHPNQSMDVFTLSESLACACQLCDAKVVEEVKAELSARGISLSLSEESHSNTEVRNFAKKIYRSYVASDWQSALASVDKLVESVLGMKNKSKNNNKTKESSEVTMMKQSAAISQVDGNQQKSVVDADLDGDEDDAEAAGLDAAAIEAKLAALEEEAKSIATSSKTGKNDNNNNNNNGFNALTNLHSLLFHVEDPKTLRNVLNFLESTNINKNGVDHDDDDDDRRRIARLPRPTEQTWSSLIRCHGKKGDWQSAMQVLQEMIDRHNTPNHEADGDHHDSDKQQQHQGGSRSSFSSSPTTTPRPGPYCYAQVLKSLSRYQSASKTENFVDLLKLCEMVVEDMTESQIPHTPEVVEAVVGVFEARQAVHIPAEQAPKTENNEDSQKKSL